MRHRASTHVLGEVHVLPTRRRWAIQATSFCEDEVGQGLQGFLNLHTLFARNKEETEVRLLGARGPTGSLHYLRNLRSLGTEGDGQGLL